MLWTYGVAVLWETILSPESSPVRWKAWHIIDKLAESQSKTKEQFLKATEVKQTKTDLSHFPQNKEQTLSPASCLLTVQGAPSPSLATFKSQSKHRSLSGIWIPMFPWYCLAWYIIYHATSLGNQFILPCFKWVFATWLQGTWGMGQLLPSHSPSAEFPWCPSSVTHLAPHTDSFVLSTVFEY